ncbi:MAG: TGS domain-containing protein, partial [Nanoarchaeota archaeon]
GRVKQIYSIYKKMISKDEYKDAIPYDVIGLRIITENVEQCYNILRIAHSLFRYVPDRLKDYIALPKPNGYQSIHTGIIYEDEIIEIQIRTKDMNENAGDGIASHFSYKGMAQNRVFDKKISWIKELVHENNKVDINFFSDIIFVFTPKGKAIELPKGSTPVDFAYMLHTDIGKTCVGAKINGNIAQLNKELENGDIVDIITNKSHNAVKDWLKFVKTNKARDKIKHDIKSRTGLSINAMQKKEEVKEEAGYGLIKLENYKDKKIKLAQCCNPLPGDDISGALSGLKSAIIHKNNCDNLKNNNKKCLAKWIDPKNYYIELIIIGKDRVGLFTEILNSASTLGVNIKDAKGKTINQNNIECRFGINIDSLKLLTDIINRVKKVKNVSNVFVNLL